MAEYILSCHFWKPEHNLFLCLIILYIISVHIVGKHEGRVFEDRTVHCNLNECSEHGVVPGVERALTNFKKDEKSILKLKPKYGYGEVGCPEKDIPPNADLTYEVTMKNFEKVSELILSKSKIL